MWNNNGEACWLLTASPVGSQTCTHHFTDLLSHSLSWCVNRHGEKREEKEKNVLQTFFKKHKESLEVLCAL